MTDTVWTLVATEWSPANPLLATVHEGDAIAFTIACTATYESVGVGGLVETKTEACTITTVAEKPRDTITINGGVIAGSLVDVFDRTIQYMNRDRSYTTVNGYSQIDQAQLFKLISVQPSRSGSESFSFTCTAVEAAVVQVYNVVVQNDWTSDNNALQAFVAQTAGLGVEELA